MDLYTLHVEHAALLTLLAILTFINIRIHRNAAGVVWFAGFGSCICAGAILIASHAYVPELLSTALANTMFSAGYLCLHLALTGFFATGSSQWRIQAGLVAVQIVSQIEFSQFHPDMTKRLLAMSIILALQLAVTAVCVVQHIPAFMRAAGWLMGVLLALLSLGNLGRFCGLLIQPNPIDYLQSGGMLAWTVLNTTVLQVGILVAFVWMTAARLHHDLEMQALTDPLTGVWNRRAIELLAKRAFATNLRGSRPISAILFDLDNFKKVNDSFGHLCGDNMLVAIAHCVEQKLRPGDMMARLGGDEFVVLLEATDIETANVIAGRLRSAIKQLRIRYERHEISATASFGVGQLQNNSGNWNDLLSLCDQALYAEKDQGRAKATPE